MSKIRMTVAFLLFISLIVSVEAYNRLIYSNTATDNVSDYVLGTLTSDSSSGVLYSNVTYHGSLSLAGSPATGKTVYLFQSTDNATGWTQIGSATTDLLGNFQITINRTSLGFFYRKAGYDVLP